MTAIPTHDGTDNVLNDLGFPDSAELTVKTILAKKLNEIIDSRRLTQNDAAECSACRNPSFRRSETIGFVASRSPD